MSSKRLRHHHLADLLQRYDETGEYFGIVTCRFGIVSCYHNREQKDSDTELEVGQYPAASAESEEQRPLLVSLFQSEQLSQSDQKEMQHSPKAFHRRKLHLLGELLIRWSSAQGGKKESYDEKLEAHVGKDLEVLKPHTCCWGNTTSRFRHIFHHHSG